VPGREIGSTDPIGRSIGRHRSPVDWDWLAEIATFTFTVCQPWCSQRLTREVRKYDQSACKQNLYSLSRGNSSTYARAGCALSSQAPDWQLPEEAHRIERSFRFRNFREALTFVREIGELAEAEGHHPNISFGWGNATVSLRTKKIKGLHENDFIMATKIDRIFGRTATA
jgi:4a-hydroxytetrahydrobiopterin dehydratase